MPPSVYTILDLPKGHSHEYSGSDEPGEPAEGERLGPEPPHLEDAE